MTKERRNVFVVMAFGKMPRVGRKLKVAEPQDGRENNTGSGQNSSGFGNFREKRVHGAAAGRDLPKTIDRRGMFTVSWGTGNVTSKAGELWAPPRAIFNRN
jgi:hypothetical protein